MGDDDSPALHAADTMRAGDGLCDEAAVRVLGQKGRAYVRELHGVGRALRSRRRTGAWRSGAKRRTASAACFTRATRPAARSAACCGSGSAQLRRFETIDHALVTELIVERRRGARACDFDRRRRAPASFARRRRCSRPAAPARCFARRRTRRSRPATASRSRTSAGARVADLEFVQFHPTALQPAGRAAVSDLRGAARRRRAAGQRAAARAFMRRYHADGDLAPRDVVARGIVRESKRTGGPMCPDARASRRGVRAPAVSDDRRDVLDARARPRARSDSGRAGRALHHGRRRHRRVGAHVDAVASSRPARSRAPASTARTGSPATRCSKGSCSAPAPRSRCTGAAGAPH